MALAVKGHCGCAMFHDLFNPPRFPDWLDLTMDCTTLSKGCGDDAAENKSTTCDVSQFSKTNIKTEMSTTTQLDEGIQLCNSNQKKKPLEMGEKPSTGRASTIRQHSRTS